MQLHRKTTGHRTVWLCSLVLPATVMLTGFKGSAIAQLIPPESSHSRTEVGDPPNSSDELALSDIRAFSVGTETDVHSVETLDATAFNDLLLTYHQNQAAWSQDFLWVGLQFLQFLSQPITGSAQRVVVSLPGEWEPGQNFEFARIVIEDKGWLDDGIIGERYVLWIVQGESGELRIQRALRANICSRPFQEFYSIQDCP